MLAVVGRENRVLLLVGDDWAEDHHDVELMDGGGRRLAKARLPEGVAGIARLHELIGSFAEEGLDWRWKTVALGFAAASGAAAVGLTPVAATGSSARPDASKATPPAAISAAEASR